MKLNAKKEVKVAPVKTTAEAMLELRRTVACCLLWEDSFYENGETTAARIQRLVSLCPYDFVAAVAVEARTVHQLRHVPLLLLRELLRHPGRNPGPATVKDLIPQICTRADQLAELVQLYWATNDGKKTLPAQLKKGLAAAFARFDGYALAKNDHQSAEVKLRDVAFLTHPSRAKDGFEASDFKGRVYKDKAGKVLGAGKVLRSPGSVLDQLCENELPAPETWEVKLSAAKGDAERRAVFEDLLASAKLGGLAWLRNLRKMDELGVSHRLLTEYGQDLALKGKLDGILPFQFRTAARVCPWSEGMLEPLMLRAVEGRVKLPGKTVILVDVSGSMNTALAQGKGRSDQLATLRLDAAEGLAMLAREACESAEVWTFSNNLVFLNPQFRGFTLARMLRESQPHSGTMLAAALRELKRRTTADRTLVITDEQSNDGIAPPLGRGYVMNVASYSKGVGNAKAWTTISGWAPAVLDYVALAEAL
jgi:hypothetical protein